MSTTQLKAYEILKKHFTEQEATIVIEYFESAADERINARKDIFLTKDDKIDIITKIEQSKTDTIKWLLAFWFGQIIVIGGILMYFLRK